MNATALCALASLFLISCQERPAPGEPAPGKPAPEVPPAADPTDPDAYLGKTQDEAAAMAEEAGIRWRVVEVDGKSRPVTMDHRPDRLNFAIANGKIIRVTKG